jgi:UDPglucose 6-dehydrogenase
MTINSKVTVGWVGLGKLGLPCALAMAKAGHTVCGTDVNKDVRGYLEKKAIPYQEEGVPELLESGVTVTWHDTIEQVARDANLIFVAVQTPHKPECEGIEPFDGQPQDFFYGFLEAAVKELVRVITRPTVVVIVSTVLPGTTRRLLLPHVAHNQDVHLIYSPCFIAMGTTVHDWTHPEFVLAGGGDGLARWMLKDAHQKMHGAPVLSMSIESAELTKMVYNAAIGMKISLANTVMEMCDKLGANCDDVSTALSQATDRIVSSRYMRGGMGDGGGCHPRDQIALSHLAKELRLSTDPFGWLVEAREKQTQWLADVVTYYAELLKLPVLVCGPEYKKNTNLEIGSPSKLLFNLMKHRLTVSWAKCSHLQKGIYVIGCNHDEYKTWKFPVGSVVIDPWGMIDDQPGVMVYRVGRR